MNERLKTHSKTQKKSADLVSNKLRIGVFQRYQMKCKSVSKKSPRYIDEPMNNTTRLQCMSAAVIALTRWEPRIALDAIDVVWKAGGRAGVTLSGTVMQTMQNVELTITLRE